MVTLVLHTPDVKNKKSFQSVLASGIGDRYAIYQNLFEMLSPGAKVVLLRKKDKRRAEGTLVELKPRGKTDNGIQRYDVHIDGLRVVSYKSEKLNRCGIAVY